ncbi:hypothetical protein MP228_004940 [Amoeboaphelidium protococcarum]|nr:hypothetical protein MP228_004940 [Amoeboaphelidium protococcarum]
MNGIPASLLFGNLGDSGDQELASLLSGNALAGLQSMQNGSSDSKGVVNASLQSLNGDVAGSDLSEIDVDDDDLIALDEDEDPLSSRKQQSAEMKPLNINNVDDDSRRVATEEEVKQVFPLFTKDGPLKFTELFSGIQSNSSQRTAGSTRAYKVQDSVEEPLPKEIQVWLEKLNTPAPNDLELFNSYRPLPQKSDTGHHNQLRYSQVDKSFQNNLMIQSSDQVHHLSKQEQHDLHPISITNWEDDIIWDVSDQENCDKLGSLDLIEQRLRNIPNFDLIDGEWEDQIIWDEQDAERLAKVPVIVNLNDPFQQVDSTVVSVPGDTQAGRAVAQSQMQRPPKKRGANAAIIRAISQVPAEKLNLSNDRYYESIKKRGRVRQHFGRIFIQHSLPALKLQMPFFKRYMSKSDLRAWHRPQFKVNGGDTVQFSKVKALKKNKIRGLEVTEVLSSAKDLTLKDNSDFVLMEYSEEYPPLVSNVGMGSFIMNYYRKTEEKDPFIPKLADGMPSVLEQVDASPFFCFGNVKQGETVQAIKNNLFIAPIWKQELHNDDFLFIRTTLKGRSSFYLRPIMRAYAVGQTIPLMHVPPPQSRKVKFLVRDRLKVAALRRIKKRGRDTKYPINRVINSYYRYHDQSLKKHLKELFNVQKAKKSNKVLISIRDRLPLPSEQELFRMLTPEQIVAFDSMRVGQQRLADCGYGSGEIGTGGDDEDAEEQPEVQLDEEIQMSPWNICKNVLLAASSKGMVQVFGPGDPTGRGEAFSFFWFSSKEMFLWNGATHEDFQAYYASQVKTGHKFSLTDQQRFYKKELQNVWNAQAKALSSNEEPELDVMLEDDDNEQAEAEAEMQEMMKMIQQSQQLQKVKYTSLLDDEDTQSVTSSRATMMPKGYLIKRRVKDETGKEVWQEEVITDTRIINAYLKQKRLIELSGGDSSIAMMDVDDNEMRKKKIQEEMRRLKREHGLTAKDLATGPVQGIDESGLKRLGSSHRKCRACGQIGHIMTNKVCPLFAQNFPERAKKEQERAEAAAKRQSAVKKQEGGKLVFSSSALKAIQDKKAARSAAGSTNSLDAEK